MPLGAAAVPLDQLLMALYARIVQSTYRDAPAPAIDGLIRQTLALAATAQQQGWRGVPELLRLLAGGLELWHGDRGALPPQDLARLEFWFLRLRGYCRHELTDAERETLVDELGRLAWVPGLSARMKSFILARLQMPAVQAGAETEAASEPATTVALAAYDTLPPALAPAHMAAMPRADAVPAMAAVTEDESAFAATIDGAVAPAAVATADALPFAAAPLAVPCLDRDGSLLAAALAGAESDADAGIHEQNVQSKEMGIDDKRHSSAASTGDGDLSVLWIAAAELELAAEAVASQLVPLVEQLQAAPAATPLYRETLETYRYQTGLVCNALEVLGLVPLHRACEVVAAEIDHLCNDGAPHAVPLELLWRWQLALFDWLVSPQERDTAACLVDALSDPDWCQALEPDVAGELLRDLARLRVGRDPDEIPAWSSDFSAQDVQLAIAPDVLASVRDGMLLELPGHAAALGQRLRALAERRDDEDIAVARRVAHTLKGDANTVGVRGIANLAHALEDILLVLAGRAQPPEPALAVLLGEAGDCIEAMADYLLGRGAAPDDALGILQRAAAAARELLADTDTRLPVRAAATVLVPLSAPLVLPAAAAPLDADTAPRPEAAEARLQVAVSTLDTLLRLSSETIVVARQVEERLRSVTLAHAELQQQNRFNRDLVGQLDDLVSLRGAALQSARLTRAEGVDVLEIDQYNELHMVSRRLSETHADTAAHLHAQDRSLIAIQDLIAQQDQAQQELQGEVMGTRSVALEQQVPRLQRVVRQTARTLGRQAELEVSGAATRMDSDILDRLIEPLMHALRNAVDHGIEPADERIAAGKPPVGRIRVQVERRGAEIALRIDDDGSGLDYAAIRTRALQRGLLSADAAAAADDEALARLILLPGFSTRSETTQTSGRGIGMDVVYRRVIELRGSLQIASRRGQGLRLDLLLPANLVSAHAALARSGAGMVAAVASGIAQFVPVLPGVVQRAADGLWMDLDGTATRAVPLDVLMGNPDTHERLDDLRLGMVVESDLGQRYVVLTSAVEELRSVIVKGLGAYVAAIPGVRGATILGTGAVAPVVDLGQLLGGLGQDHLRHSAASEIAARPSRRVVVADDSLSVRRALEQLMQDAGYDVVCARDGIEVLGLIESAPPLAVLVDLEMPRMNGLELTAFLRNNPATAQVPVIMITSRSSERHRLLAQGAGVDHVVSKPYNDDQLVDLLRRSLAAAG